MGWGKTAAKKAATAAARAGTGDGGFVTDRAGRRLSCQFCGRPVNSRLGGVCSRPRCHRRAVLAEED
jgi:hypothetical protein